MLCIFCRAIKPRSNTQLCTSRIPTDPLPTSGPARTSCVLSQADTEHHLQSQQDIYCLRASLSQLAIASRYVPTSSRLVSPRSTYEPSSVCFLVPDWLSARTPPTMPIEIAMQTPLADALQREVQKKLVENGWAPSDDSDNTMAEYIILMLVNGRGEDDITGELARDLLNLDPEDNSAREFSTWLFQTAATQNAILNGPPAGQAPSAEDNGDHDMDMDLSNVGAGSDMNAYVFSLLRVCSLLPSSDHPFSFADQQDQKPCAAEAGRAASVVDATSVL